MYISCAAEHYIEQSFCTQLCIYTETRSVILLIKMKALKKSGVLPCPPNRSALLNGMHDHLISDLDNLC